LRELGSMSNNNFLAINHEDQTEAPICEGKSRVAKV
jgi:hypothetical protein